MWRSRQYGNLGPILGALLWVAPVAVWAKTPKNEARLRGVEKLRKEYERLYGEGKYGEAAGLAERVCVILEQQHGRNSVEAAACLNDLGVQLTQQGAYEIGIGAPGDPRRPLPHHPACGSALGGSTG